MKAMASRGATPPRTTERRSRERDRAGGRAPAILWLAFPGLAALALGAGLPVGATTRVGLIALGLLLVVARGVRGVARARDCPPLSRWSLPARQAGTAPVGSHRAGREARSRVPGVGGTDERERRASLRRARPVLPAGRHAWRGR